MIDNLPIERIPLVAWLSLHAVVSDTEARRLIGIGTGPGKNRVIVWDDETGVWTSAPALHLTQLMEWCISECFPGLTALDQLTPDRYSLVRGLAALRLLTSQEKCRRDPRFHPPS